MLAAARIVETDGDRIAFDGIDVHVIARHRGELSAADTRADHNAVDLKKLFFARLLDRQRDAAR
ncbi:hypothetical protein GCM10010985_31550 [Caballeronia grimmiae]|uniref:Uncharacterized protein n=1 Tax=Caballeronia grimmiae TaxID=1071679 RepID=A0ABQ1RPE9_9BURK|nr:hypothetical protein GCM10010985_31550 [Caballeronia grimmiae]